VFSLNDTSTQHDFEIVGELSDAAIDGLADLILADIEAEEEEKRPHAEVTSQHAGAKGQ